MEIPILPEQQEPKSFRRILRRIVPHSTNASRVPASTNRMPFSENIAPVATDRSILTSGFGDDPVRSHFENIMSNVSPEMRTAWSLWTSTDEDTMSDPKSLKRLQEFGRLAIDDAQYQNELHRLIQDRLGTAPITVYHPISTGGSVLEGATGFMPGTTSLLVAKFYTDSGHMAIEQVVIRPDDIVAIGHLSQSEVIFIPR